MKVMKFVTVLCFVCSYASAEDIFVGGNNFGPINQIELNLSNDPIFGGNAMVLPTDEVNAGHVGQMNVDPELWQQSIERAFEYQFTKQVPDDFDFNGLPSLVWELVPGTQQNCTPNNGSQFICGPVPVPESPHPFLQCPGPDCPLNPDGDIISSAGASVLFAMPMQTSDDDNNLSMLDAAALIQASTGFEPKKLSDEEAQFGWSSVALAGGMGGAFCTGVAVSPNLVLTAAHCTCGTINSNRLSAIVMGPELMSPRSVVLNVVGEPQTFQNDYCRITEAEQVIDVALISVETDFGPVPDDFIATLRFDASFPVNRAILFGFGKTDDDHDGGERAAFVYDLVDACDQKAATDVKCRVGAELYSKLPTGVVGGGCGGDSGGPIFDASGHLFAIQLRGIDRSIDHQFNCGGGGIFLDLGSQLTNSEGLTVREWLNENI